MKETLLNPKIEARVDAILAMLSVEEKIGQLFQEKAECENLEELKSRIRAGRVGSLILASTAFAGNEKQIALSVADLNELQRIAVEESPQGIPMIYGRDIIHGCRTVMPVPLGQACAWDTELVKECSTAAAREASARGVHWTFSPMIDIARDPRWGRVVEGYGEDPYLTGQLGAAAVEGYQGSELQQMKQSKRVVACAKHFIGYGASEGGRDYETTEITEHSLRNVYMPPFREVLDRGCMTVMSSFNELNGETTSGSHRLLTELLKEELGFAGFVVSDWAAVEELISHGIAANHREAARISLSAGMDMEMVTRCFLDSLESLLESGAVSAERLDDAVRRVLRVKLMYGLFEDPYTPVEPEALEIHASDQALARRAVAESAVLLKNRAATLPLQRSSGKTLLTGPLLHAQAPLLGTWSMDGQPGDVTTYQAAFAAEWGSEAYVTHDPALMDQGLAMAHNHKSNQIDQIVVFIGEDSSRGGEHFSVSDLSLPPGQVEYVESLAAIGLPLTVVITAGRPLLIERVMRCADAVLYSFHGGVQAGPGVFDALTGAHDPRGHLPITFPRATGQIPIYYNRKTTGRPWSNGYIDQVDQPSLPFGYGLSYTSFEVAELSVNASSYPCDAETVELSLRVSNTGPRAGKALLQFYAHDHVASLARPTRFLCHHLWVPLAAAESQVVQVRIPTKRLGFYNRQGELTIEPGQFTFYAGLDSNADLNASLELVE
ncbi:glycoside hydrolase family 3 N-terminal domain-containing protein [Coraliomargarita sp. SDUM461003]|uniref:beta-glucosidase n=1 Tax=Thalassobacterium maritimum TaxID=3041265 RepID=A0ABU1ARJ7_9BACT|nr:glycoside hydrolase family 3 N-terminal domain-containing protein [Coraliomargarita sp. SDUM461003]MDQ8206775.1 glycoside hydrolase family 3 N-terminal domain-containing protein [Coraliomargarita sp. SDUM461003]